VQVKYRVHYVEFERGWGVDHWYVDYDTAEEAQASYDRTNSKLTGPMAPDAYIKALQIEIVQTPTK
jgi:hypothetical protein